MKGKGAAAKVFEAVKDAVREPSLSAASFDDRQRALTKRLADLDRKREKEEARLAQAQVRMREEIAKAKGDALAEVDAARVARERSLASEIYPTLSRLLARFVKEPYAVAAEFIERWQEYAARVDNETGDRIDGAAVLATAALDALGKHDACPDRGLNHPESPLGVASRLARACLEGNEIAVQDLARLLLSLSRVSHSRRADERPRLYRTWVTHRGFVTANEGSSMTSPSVDLPPAVVLQPGQILCADGVPRTELERARQWASGTSVAET